MRKPLRSNRNVELKPHANFIKKLAAANLQGAPVNGLTLTQFLELQAHTPKSDPAKVKVTPPKNKDVDHE